MSIRRPVYLCHQPGFLSAQLKEIVSRASPCILCPRHCRVNRSIGKIGFCATGLNPVIASYGPHHGEEEPLSGIHGSGTVFFSGCTMRCTFCQNYEISRGYQGTQVTEEELAEIFLKLQGLGCHNINLVTPTHQLPAIIGALIRAIDAGLCIPLVYNTGGYDDEKTLRLLDGIVDIYMPDLKFAEDETGQIIAETMNYPTFAYAAIREMHRQVGDLRLRHGIATRGLLVRHLILPGLAEESKEILRFIAEEVSKNTWVNIMDQYYPAGDIVQSCPSLYPSLTRRVTQNEVELVCKTATGYGLSRGFFTSQE
ncbi:MAG: radical SAM protein [Methanospirillaceae archaeon]|nr:radical SAM protein [Methanospirillaceae archaeon]